ncbi:ABC transporter ATP-binding protein [Mesorhizobium sp.]|uniref:ABC transporter ATP-binding protein n=1 Tax=Mesorhizobium sp. TaxID=1871066 RepID=UPI000FE77EC9|nr:ABC transporter ATP-binding protein [Mesorhizobium sp.]RWJ05715.1 MAG: ABC transporter ATP-binding protein [Mesorhizobium sp.]
MPLLEIEDLQVHFVTQDAVVRAVNGVSFTIEAGETVAVVGESGCGKSVTSMSILRLLPNPPAHIGGRIVFDGRNLLDLDEASIRAVRGSEISMIFQEPMSSLNPIQTIGKQIGEAARLHMKMNRRQAREAAVVLLDKVGFPSPRSRVDDYPHQLSGGMRQRVMIAMALICSPKLLIADEPTTALDVTIQAQILDLLAQLKQESGAAVMLVTHDLGVVAEVAQRVIVMYAGRKVEEASAEILFANPLHPYTRGLLGAVPKLGSSLRGGPREPLSEIPGLVPSPKKPIVGCAFANRCPMVQDVCRHVAPASVEHHPNHHAACHFATSARMAA